MPAPVSTAIVLLIPFVLHHQVSGSSAGSRPGLDAPCIAAAIDGFAKARIEDRIYAWFVGTDYHGRHLGDVIIETVVETRRHAEVKGGRCE